MDIVRIEIFLWLTASLAVIAAFQTFGVKKAKRLGEVEYTPANLDECIDTIIKENPFTALEEFKNMLEDEACAAMHFSAGMMLRNRWKLWERGTVLVKYFNWLGIYHPDDMSGIILRSLHRSLNSKPINIAEQIRHYKDYWKEQGFPDGNPMAKAEA